MGQGPSIDDDASTPLPIAPTEPQGEGPWVPPTGETPPDIGAGPDTDPDVGGPAPQAGPAGPQAAPQAAPQTGDIAPPAGGGGQSMTPSLDSVMPNPLQQGEAPQADIAARAPKATKAAKAQGAKNAPQAAQAPSIDGQVAGAPDLGDASKMTPASGHVIKGAKTKDGKPMVQVIPDGIKDSDFGKGAVKLEDVHTPEHLIDSLTVPKQNIFMDWWEQQHGAINDRYDSLRADLGQRPDPNRDPTRKEKFVALMHFGLHLMQNAKRGNDPMAAVGQSAEEALAGQKQHQVAQTEDYDSRVAGIEGQRQTQLKNIGNYGQAVREDALIQNANVRTEIARLNAGKAPKTGQPTTRILSDGTQVDYDPDSKSWNPSVDKNGKPIGKMPLQGPRGGMGRGESATVQNIKALEARNYSTADAVNMVLHHKPTGDPQKDYVSILNKNTPPGASAAEIENARATAEETINHIYGEGALDNARARRDTTIRGPATPPPVPPPPGKIGKDAQGNRWKNVNGKAVLVQ